MPTLHDVTAAFTLKAPTSLQQIRDALVKVRYEDDPSLVDVQALAGFVRAKVPASHQAAVDKIRAFAERVGQLAFANFRRLTVATQLILRLIWPETTEQKNTEFCGPTAFVINFCRMQPLAWADLAINLAERGTAHLGNLTLAPGSGVKNRQRTNIGSTAEADWIVIASLRDTVSSDAAHRVQSWIFRKSFEEVGISWESMEKWCIDAGFASVISMGGFNDTTFTSNFYTRPGLSLPRLAITFKATLGICTPDKRAVNMLQFAEKACGNDWAVFLFVDDKLGRAIDGSGLADAQWLSDQRAARGQLGAVADKAMTKGLYQGVARTLTGPDVGGHVFLLLDLEVGGMYVSLTGINRGKLVTPQLLPKAAFSGAVRGIVAATDSA